MLRFIRELGAIVLFTKSILYALWIGPASMWHEILHETSRIFWRSLQTISFAGFFVGAILILQFDTILARYDARLYLGGVCMSTIIRDVGPLIIAFLLVGKVGAYTAAELGTMRVTEQIDARECLGAESFVTLLAPRWMSIVLASLTLLIAGLSISIGGAFFLALIHSSINMHEFLFLVPRFNGFSTLGSGLLKSFIYGLLVATLACFYGFYAKNGAAGVGRAVTKATVGTHFSIIVANYLTGTLLTALEHLGGP